MTDKIVSLVTARTQANVELITILEGLLEQAKLGEIVSLSYAALLANGDSQTQASFTDTFQALIGAMRILEFRMMDESRTTR